MITSFANAQYFYKDIWNAQQLNREFAVLKNENIRTVSIKSFEDDGSPSEGFFCERRIDKNYSRSQTISRSNVTAQSELISFYDERGMLLKNIDSTENSYNRTDFTYEKGKIKMITFFTRADDDSGGITETREYFYTAAGKPEKMIRKKNNTEAATINFVTDEKGNIIEEQEIVKGTLGKKYLYYYDDKNRLTDVVHYNERAQRLLPDYMYEYNQIGQVKQLISTEEGSSNYFTWAYTYNDRKLRETETCLSKEKRLLGTIQYQYK
jgi:hypothetical protein